MIIMPANHSSNVLHYWQGTYGSNGHLYSPKRAWTPYPWLPYALDNGAFVSWDKGVEWDAEAFVKHCDSEALLRSADRIKLFMEKPLWIVVPDLVADRLATLAKWAEWEPKLRQYRCPLAFVAQDGMSPKDVPSDADVIFIGGSTEWKLANIHRFCQTFPRVHVGRVNTLRRLWLCCDAGAESCDGTGWFREGWRNDPKGLEFFLKVNAGLEVRQHQLSLHFGA